MGDEEETGKTEAYRDRDQQGLEALFAAAHEAAEAVTETEVIQTGGGDLLRLITPSGWSSSLVSLEKYERQPRRKRGIASFDRAVSFISYVKRHVGDGTHIYARGAGFNAILNGHEEGLSGWGDHQAHLTLKETESWKAWTQANQTWMSQEAFAEFLEDRLVDVAQPAGGTLLDIATNLKVNTAVKFQSRVNLADGQVQLTYEEQIESGAGPKGEVKIPEFLKLHLSPYEGVAAQPVDARFRWRLGRGDAKFQFALGDEIRRIREEALATAATEISEALAIEVLFGRWDEADDDSAKQAG